MHFQCIQDIVCKTYLTNFVCVLYVLWPLCTSKYSIHVPILLHKFFNGIKTLTMMFFIFFFVLRLSNFITFSFRFDHFLNRIGVNVYLTLSRYYSNLYFLSVSLSVRHRAILTKVLW